ncbi:MAG: L-seryl-tRNA(Sec) selenium transferase [Geobacteraceae bacterium]|nr:L-seryl-tRNA(Sec) selenium transferase [Geobacteraceae bacterium]NTW81130.1 L-seryl-tRNA(Sec) selenium transferase [Geobacteraceae bacterium]
MKKNISSIPKVDKVLSLSPVVSLLETHPRPTVLAAVRNVLAALRIDSLNGTLTAAVDENHLCGLIVKELESIVAPSLHPVVNGTGVVIHTNLGRSLLSKSACRQIQEVSERYSNLEMDMATGARGERYTHVESLLCELTGAEAAIVVNNNAAAVLLALSGMAAGKEVVVSRGELVEIGGSFRIPDVMRLSGGILKEVGTTNRTHLKDYQTAISEETALFLKVHTSNFSVVGFTAEVTIDQLVQCGKEKGIPVMADIGSGSLLDLSKYGITGEIPVQEYLKAGVDILTCSGDKMLGGPQAGIILGKRKIISILRKEQLLRALRIDKMTLAALEATLRLYRDERDAVAEIPTLRMLTVQPAVLKAKASSYIRRIRPKIPSPVTLTVVAGNSQVGGGSLPTLDLPTFLMAIAAEGWSPQQIDSAFRQCKTPVMGRINKGQYLLDLRTLQDADIPALVEAMEKLG